MDQSKTSMTPPEPAASEPSSPAMTPESTCKVFKPNTGDIDRTSYHHLHPDGRRLIKGWFQRAERIYEANPKNTFEAFIFTWIAFNGWSACVAGTDRDSDWVQMVAEDNQLCTSFLEYLDTDAAFRQQAENFQSFWPIFKASEIRRGELRFEDHDAPRKDFINYYMALGYTFAPVCWKEHKGSVPLDWTHTLVTLYRVRNNLFHGEKARHSEMDHRIVEASYLVLSTFIRKLQLFN